MVLSYPIAINDWTSVKIEMKQKTNGKYVFILYVNDEKVEESIEVKGYYKVNVIGMSKLMTNVESYFKGYIRNFVIYN